MVLPSPDAHSRNVRLLVGSHAQKRRRFTIDIRNLEACPGSRASADDGLTPRLRWQLYPPPLTIFSAKFLLGWMSLDLLVPPAAPKRAPSGRWQEPPLPMELAEPWTAHRDPETGRTFYYNATTKDAIWHKPREPLRHLLTWNCLSHGRRIVPRARTGSSTTTRSLESLPGTVHE